MLAVATRARLSQLRYTYSTNTSQVTAPIWASEWAAITGVPTAFRYEDGSGNHAGLAWPGAGCGWTFDIPTAAPAWEALWDVSFAGNLEEFLHFVPSLPAHPSLVFLGDAEGSLPSYSERFEARVDGLLVIPQPLNRPALSQSEVGLRFVPHLREAVRSAGGEVQGWVELAQFSQRVRAQLQLPAELYIFRFRLILREKTKPNKYELQV